MKGRMTSKSKSQKNIVEGDVYIDRISSLPENVKEHILDCMPTRDGARTCVLSTRWRYVWAGYPSLVLDKCFLDSIHRNRFNCKLVIDYPIIVNKMLVHHVGYIRRFVLHVSSALSSMEQRINIDLWLSSLFRKGLKELELKVDGRNPYKVPCLVFSSSELVELNLSFCIIRSGCCTNIQTLILQKITFDSSVVLTTPSLTFLKLESCCGILHFDISAPRLETLSLVNNDNLNLKPFLACAAIDYVLLYSSGENAYFDGCESFCLEKLLAAWPRISELVVDGFCFKYLATGSVPCILDQLNLRSVSIRALKLDSELMPWILCILKRSRLLRTFKISFCVNDLNGGMSYNIDESTSVLDFRMDQLHTVIMGGFTATPNELVLTKILLHCAPVLENMFLEENDKLDPKEHVRILKNLLALQRAYPKARIFFGPN